MEWLFLSIVFIGMISYEILDRYFEYKDKEKTNRNCTNCKKHKTMKCPNSSKCYSTIDKPYFERSENSK